MIELKGKFATAKVFTNNIEQEAISQIIELLNQDFAKNSKIAIMPDIHAGKGCVIGFTADLGHKVIPNIVGVDIGCGMETVELGKINIDLALLDYTINNFIPSGRNTHEGKVIPFPEIQELYCFRELKDTKRMEKSIGTLGGGNHFIEINEGKDNNKYLVIHSGSRNLGKQVAEHYQKMAIELCSGKENFYKEKDYIIEEYKKQGKRKEIQSALKKIKAKYENLRPSYPDDLCFLAGEWREKYLHDMKICQEYAVLNRKVMAKIIINNVFGRNENDFSSFTTIHNYINFSDNIIRKGAISAKKGERVLIPINMRDGSILAVGKGNTDWNCSAPHGAGRLMSRSKAKQTFQLADYQETMKGVYTTSINESTLDECPMAYKPIEEIMDNIQDTVDVIDVIRPLYNYKSNS